MPRRSGDLYWDPDRFSKLLQRWLDADPGRLKWHFAAKVQTTPGNIRRLERERDVNPGISLCRRIALELGVTVAELAPFPSEEKPDQ